jgi:hypothetical protein
VILTMPMWLSTFSRVPRVGGLLLFVPYLATIPFDNHHDRLVTRAELLEQVCPDTLLSPPVTQITAPW